MQIRVEDAILGKPKTALVKPEAEDADPEVHVVITLSIPVTSLSDGQLAALIRNAGQEVEVGLERLEARQARMPMPTGAR